MLARLLLLGTGLSACHRSPPPAAAPMAAAPMAAVPNHAPPLLVAAADYRLPRAVPPPKVHLACAPAAPRASRARDARVVAPPARWYEFAPIVLVPIRRGPLIADRPRVGFARTEVQLPSTFAAAADDVTACWKWASARDPRPTSLEAQLTVDPFGVTRGVRVTSVDPRDDALVACVREALAAPAPSVHVQPRSMRVTATLALRLEDQPPWRKLPARPRQHRRPTPNPHAPAGTLCTWVLDELADEAAIEERRVPLPLVISDWDAARVVRGSPVRWARSNCRFTSRDIDKPAIRTAVRSNLGALQACYADAVQRTPGLVGDVAVHTRFDASGTAATPQVRGAGDPQLHACIGGAIQALWVEPLTGGPLRVEVDFTFTLAPAPTPARADDPDALLAAGDVDGALARWVGQVTTPHPPLAACRARAGIVRAMTEVAPWLDDERVRATIADLARVAVSLPADAGRACLADVDPLLQRYIGMQGAPTSPGVHAAIRHLERYEAVLPLAGLVAWGPRLRWHHAAHLLSTPRADEGQRLLAELAGAPPIGAEVDAWLAQRAARVAMIGDTCSWR